MRRRSRRREPRPEGPAEASMTPRRGIFAEFAGGAVKYFFIGTVARGASLAVVPVLLRYLTAKEYGLQAIALLNEQILMIVAGYAFTNSLGKYYSEARQAGEDGGVVVGTALRAIVLAGIVAGAIWQLAAVPISRLTLDASHTSLLATRLVGFSFLPSLIIVLATTVWQLDQAYLPFGIANVGQYAGAASLGVVFVVLGSGAIGPVIGWLVASALAALLSLVWLARHARLAYSRAVFARLSRYGAPLVPAALVMLVLSVNDRYLLTRIAGLRTVGVYAAVLTVANAITTGVVTPVKRVWFPLMWRMRHADDEEAFHRRTFTYYCAGQAWILVALVVFGKLIMDAVSGGRRAYTDAAPALAVVYAGLSLLNAADFLSAGIFFEGRTGFYTLAVFASTVAAVAFNVAFIPLWGLWAAAWSNPVSYVVLALVTLAFARRYFRVDYDRKRLLKVAIVSALISAAGLSLQPDRSPVRAAIALIVVGGFPLWLSAVRFYTPDEAGRLRTLRTSLLARSRVG